MNRYIGKRGVLVFGLFVFLAFVSVGYARAQGNPFSVQFPISELGNCGSLAECKSYCDDAINARACGEWAERNGFGPRVRPPVVESGPGGCRGRECEEFCEALENQRACLDFAEQRGLISNDEASRVRSSIDRGQPIEAGPGGCKSREDCDAFCRNPGNQNTCIDFGVEKGFISPEEAVKLREFSMSRPQVRGPARGPNRGPHRPRGPERIQEIEEPKIDEEKAMRIIGELGGGPGGCNSFDSCDKFCSAPSHDEECLAFAIEHELIQGPDIERIKKFQNLAGPGGCRGRACEAYCDAPGHEKECLEFAVENNLIPREEYEMVKRLIDIEGPGGCRGRACEAYCDAPGHEKECFEFAKQNGLIDPDEAAQIEKMMNVVGPGGCRGRECEQYCNDPQHGEECFAFAKEQGLISPDEIERVEEMKRIQRDIEIRSRRSIDSSRGGPGPRMEDIKRFEQDGREGMQQFNEQFNEFLPHEGSVVPMMRPEFDPSLGGPGPRMEDIKRFEQDGREGMQQFNEFLPHEGNVDPMMRPEFRQENEFFTPPSQPQQFDRAIGNPPSFQPGTQMIEPPHMEAPPPIDMHAAEPVSLLDFVIKSAATILGPFINITH